MNERTADERAISLRYLRRRLCMAGYTLHMDADDDEIRDGLHKISAIEFVPQIVKVIGADAWAEARRILERRP